MSQASDDRDEMRPDYDIRGGVRGKYFERYQRVKELTVTIEHSQLIVVTTTGSLQAARVSSAISYVLPNPSPTIQLGTFQPAASGR